MLPFQWCSPMERTIQRRVLSNLGVDYAAVGPSVGLNEWRIFHNSAEIIWNWCDLETFSQTTDADRDAARGTLGLHGDDQVLVSIGNCSPVKNHESILRAMATASMPPTVVYLHVRRRTARERGATEHRLAASLGLGDRVRFLGTVEDVWRVPSRCLTCSSCRRQNEGMAISVSRPSPLAHHARDSGSGLRDVARWSSAIDTVEASLSLSRRRSSAAWARKRPQPTITGPPCDGRAVVLSRGAWPSTRTCTAYPLAPAPPPFAGGRAGDDQRPAHLPQRREHTLALPGRVSVPPRPFRESRSMSTWSTTRARDGTAEAVAAAYPDVEINAHG